MRAIAPFTVSSFVPAQLAPAPADVETARPVGVAIVTKQFDGQITGSSVTIFTAAFDEAAGAGTYVAMESFEGTVNGMLGTMNFAHSATTTGTDRLAEFFTIVPGSGTGELDGITGSGGLRVTQEGEDVIWFDYEMPHD
ncbi:MAG: DUF3224 domain-containing protein [Solirubrobacteraceae bacterium]|nr:DUF3224 domain-containing protein [Solirubrobacteraceae bacterium]